MCSPLFISEKTMLRTKAIAARLSDVPREWVFEFYLKLGEALNGQDIQMKSIFNSKDTKPSFFLFYNADKGNYYFKDWSVGKKGDGTSLVKEMFGLTTRGEAAHKIIEDYNKHVVKDPGAYAQRVIKVRKKYKVTSFKIRKLTIIDKKYWTSFKIGSKSLKFRHVKPIEEYTMAKPDDEGSEFVVKGTQIYGYFKEDGTLYKIYQPLSKQNKFNKVIPHIQGSEQLTGKVPYLVICSSMKDLMVFDALGFTNAEGIVPDSETIILDQETIDRYKETYDGICTLLDNDQAGIGAMEQYFEAYGIPSVRLTVENDLAECVHEHGIKNTRIFVFPLLTKALTGVEKKL